MRKLTIQLLALITALFFLFFGKGVNIMTFCCNSCAEHGIEMLVSKSCSEVHQREHHDEHHDAEHSCCTMPSENSSDITLSDSEASSCNLYRLHVEEPTLGNLNLTVTPTVIALAITTEYLSVESLPELQSLYAHLPRPPIISSGRDILSLYSVLII